MLFPILPIGAHGLLATISKSSNRLKRRNDSVINSLLFYPLESQPSYSLTEKRPRVKGGPLSLQDLMKKGEDKDRLDPGTRYQSISL